MVAVAGRDGAAEDPSRLDLAERDRRLLVLRETLFGAQMRVYAQCPRCAAELEYTLDTRALRDAIKSSGRDALRARFGEVAMRLRLPDSRDLAAVAMADDADEARRTLVRRCMASVGEGDSDMSEVPIDEGALAAAGECLSMAMRDAEVTVGLLCADCGDESVAVVDVGEFLWEEIDRLARRLIGEVHAIASAYHWTEQEILGLSPVRRRMYLEMLGA
jgi:hypothetical protein